MGIGEQCQMIIFFEYIYFKMRFKCSLCSCIYMTPYSLWVIFDSTLQNKLSEWNTFDIVIHQQSNAV